MTTSANRCGQLTFLILGLLLAYLMYYLSPVLTPFLVSAILAYLCDPVVDRLMRLKLSRIVAVTIVFSTLFTLIVLLVILLAPIIQDQVVSLINQIPSMLSYLDERVIPWLRSNLGIALTESLPKIKTVPSANLVQAGGSVLRTMFQSGKSLFEGLLNLILIPVVTFYLLRDWDIMIANMHRILPRRIEPTITKIAEECDKVLSAFLRGQLLVMLILCIYYALALSVMRLQFGITIGLITGLVSIVPYLGMMVGVVIASIVSLMQYGSMTALFWVWFIFLIGHGLENLYLSPNLIGGRVGVHPIVVIFTILAGGYLFGFFGVLLALPITAVLMVVLRYLLKRYQKSNLYRTTAT